MERNTLGSTLQQAWGVFQWETTNGLATNVLVSNITVRQTGLNGSIGGTYSNAIIDGITFSNTFMPGSNTPASNLFQMDIFNQQFYTNLAILPVQTPLPAIYLTASDPNGITSFNGAGNWSNGQAPSATNNYVVGAFTLRTPTSVNAIFAGGALSLYDSATLALKNDNRTTTVGTSAANGLFLDNSFAKNVDTASDTLAGYVTLLPDGGVFRMPGGIGYTFTISALIGGPGGFQAGVTGDSGTIKLSGANTYAGGTSFGTSLSNSLTLQLSGSGTLGSTNGPLTFNNTNNLLDLNGTSQGVGNLSGPAGTILNNSASVASTLTIGCGNNGGGVFSGSIVNGSNVVALAKVGSGTITLDGNNTYTGNTIVNGGVLALSGSASISNSAAIVIAGGASFDTSGLSSVFKLASGQKLSNSTSTAILSGNANSGSGTVALTYALGTPSLMVTNGTLTLSSNTIFNVNNTGTALGVGTYLLISNAAAGAQGTVAGTLPLVTVSGGGITGGATASLQIKNQALDLAVAPPPAISRVAVSGATLTLLATNGPAGRTFVLLASTNLTLPMTQWKPVLTNSFDMSGNLNLATNIINPANPLEFYVLQIP